MNSCWAQKDAKILVFSKTDKFRHQSIPVGIETIKQLGKEHNFQVDATEDDEVLVNTITQYDAIVFLNTTGDILNKDQQKIFESYIQNGGGYVGIHSATDTEYEWPWYGKMVGGYFLGHPAQQDAKMDIVNHNHPSTSFFKEKEWHFFEEWYNFKDLNLEVDVLINLDETSYKGGKNGKHHPISWFHEFEGGRIFYTGLGHRNETYSDTKFRKHILGGLFYAMDRNQKVN